MWVLWQISLVMNKKIFFVSCFIKIGRSENHEIDTLWILFPVLTQLEFSNWILTFEVWCRTFVQNLETELREDISHFYLQSLTLPISKIWHTGIYKSGATNIRYMYVENLFIFNLFQNLYGKWPLTHYPLIVCLICLDFCICFVICYVWHVLFVYFYFKCSLKLKIDLVAVVKWVMNEGAEGSPKHRLSSFPTQLFYLPGFCSRNTPVQIIIADKILIYLCLFHPFCRVMGAE